MFYLVDTIGVKFSDEFNPPRQEIDAEFALVRSRPPDTKLNPGPPSCKLLDQPALSLKSKSGFWLVLCCSLTRLGFRV